MNNNINKKFFSLNKSMKFNNSVSLLELIKSYKQKNIKNLNKNKNNKKQNKCKMATKHLFLNKFISKSSHFKNISNETINKLISSTDMGIKYDSSLINSFYNNSINNIKSLSHTTNHKKNFFFNYNDNYKSNKKIIYKANKFLNNSNNHKRFFSNDFNHKNNYKNILNDKKPKKINNQSIQTINSNIVNSKIKNYKKKINFNLNNINNNKISLSELTKFKRSSLIDQLMFKILNPDECIEEYGISNNNIIYKYVKFKKQLINKKNKIDKIILKLQLEQRKADEEIKRYNPTLLIRQYHLKTQYNYENNNIIKNKIF